jgi:hypothetical protein
VLAAVFPGQAPGADFSHNFQGGNMPPPDRMALVGLDKMSEVTPEEGGLRIKVLAGRGKDGVGIQSRFPLSGDFEVTASFEILSADKPTKGYGAGFNVMISPAAWQEKRASLARYWTVQNGSGFQALIMLAEPKPFRETSWEPSETMKGQLRLRREGVKLLYLINEDRGQTFREIFQFDYGTDDINRVRFVANPGNSPAALDIRLLDVQIHWDGLPDHTATAPFLGVVEASQAADATTAKAPRGRHLWALLFVFLFLLCVGLLSVYLVQQRRQKATPSPKS